MHELICASVLARVLLLVAPLTAVQGVDITNFTTSFADGLAFCAILDSYFPKAVNYKALDHADQRANFTLAFKVFNLYPHCTWWCACSCDVIVASC